MTTSPAQTNANELYRMVQAYADLGQHRTGSDIDHATRDWLSAELEARGAQVLHQDFRFDFFDAMTTVLLDGQVIASMPLYYQAVGHVHTSKVAIAEFGDGEHGRGLDGELEAMIDTAGSQGYEALVIATRGESGGLVAINCEPVLRRRIPVLLVPGRYAEALRHGVVEVEYRAAIKPGKSTNVSGHWGASLPGPPVVITTPMSGWFRCAGERGTGIAIALLVAERMSRQHPEVPLRLVAPSGHELGFFGAWQMTKRVDCAPRAVLHLGSCIANRDARLQAIVHAETAARQSIAMALEPLQITPGQPENHLDSKCWVGESQCWAEFGMPMLSLAGMSPLFHTPEDLADQVTTPALLDAAANCISRAAMALVEAGRPD